MNRLTFTLKAWPVIALATIGLCFLTKTVAGWLGIDLPDQQNIDVVRQYLTHAFDSARHFGTAAFLVAQVVVLLPMLEEAYFRHFVYSRNLQPLEKTGLVHSLVPTAVIVVGGILVAYCIPGIRSYILSEYPFRPWLSYGIGLAAIAILEYFVRVFFGRLLAKVSEYAILAFSSALFAAAHYIAQPWPDAAFLALFFFGLAQCGLYRKTGRLWCAMLNHALFNLTNLVLLFILPET